MKQLEHSLAVEIVVYIGTTILENSLVSFQVEQMNRFSNGNLAVGVCVCVYACVWGVEREKGREERGERDR